MNSLSLRKKIIRVSFGALAGTLLLISRVRAATGIQNPIGAPDFDAVIANVTGWAAAIAAPLTALMVLIAGALYMTSGGSPDRVKRAHQALVWSIVGFAVTLFSTVAYALIKNILGTK